MPRSPLAPLRRLVVLAACVALAPRDAAAQRVLAPESDASTLRRGVLRTSFGVENILLNGRWNDGRAEELGAGLSVNLDNGSVEALSPILTALAEVGRGDITSVSLGRSQLQLRQRLAITRLGVEYGITDRLMFRAQVPLVRGRAEAQLGLDGLEASVGLNPSLAGSGVAAANRAIFDAYQSAAASLAARRDACAGNPAAFPECGSINAEGTQVNAAIVRSLALANSIGAIYGAQGVGAGLRYVPMRLSQPEAALQGVAALLQADFARWGVTDVTASTGFPTGAQAPITADELARLVTADVPDGLAARLPARTARQDLGDIDLGLTFRVLDRIGPAAETDTVAGAARPFGWRASVALNYRLGGGTFDLPDQLTDLGTGSGHDAIGVQGIADLVFTRNLWASLSVGWAQGAAHERVMRLPLIAGSEWIALDQQVPVRITPASQLELRVAPRWVFNDFIAAGAEWRYRRRGVDEVEASQAPARTPVGGALPYGDGALQPPSDSDEQRWAWTLTYSSRQASGRGVARLPLDVHYAHEQSVGSSRGIVPRRWEDRVTIRVYTRLFGR